MEKKNHVNGGKKKRIWLVFNALLHWICWDSNTYPDWKILVPQLYAQFCAQLGHVANCAQSCGTRTTHPDLDTCLNPNVSRA